MTRIPTPTQLSPIHPRSPHPQPTMSTLRTLHPATQPPSPPPEAPLSVSPPKPKRAVTLGACVACRKRKTKCDATRPICGCCRQKTTACVYELGPNEKPSQALKRKNDEMQRELDRLRGVMDVLRGGTEDEAIGILRGIRAGEEWARLGELHEEDRSRPKCCKCRHDSTHSVTLPSIRLALDASEELPGGGLLHEGLGYMNSEGRSCRRRKYGLGVGEVLGRTG